MFNSLSAISWIEDCESKENDEDSSSRVRKLSNYGKHKLINIVTSGRSKRPQRQCRLKKKVKHISFVNFAKGDCFERYHTVKKYYLLEKNHRELWNII